MTVTIDPELTGSTGPALRSTVSSIREWVPVLARYAWTRPPVYRVAGVFVVAYTIVVAVNDKAVLWAWLILSPLPTNKRVPARTAQGQRLACRCEQDQVEQIDRRQSSERPCLWSVLAQRFGDLEKLAPAG